MKKLFVLPVLFLILFFIGCQENQILEPNVPDGNNSLAKKEIINLCYPIMDPLSGQCYISGKLIYEHSSTQINPVTTVIELNLQLNALLIDEAHVAGNPKWIIVGESNESFRLTKTMSGNNLFKSENLDERYFKGYYNVTNRKDIKLELSYMISETALTIQCMKIVPSFVIHSAVTTQ